MNEPLKESLINEIYAKRTADIADPEARVANADSLDIDEEDLIEYEPIRPELPPASSNRHKWWLDRGNCHINLANIRRI